MALFVLRVQQCNNTNHLNNTGGLHLCNGYSVLLYVNMEWCVAMCEYRAWSDVCLCVHVSDLGHCFA